MSEEFIYLLKKFPLWLDGKIKEYKEWYNNKRYHRGIKAIPITLYYFLHKRIKSLHHFLSHSTLVIPARFRIRERRSKLYSPIGGSDKPFLSLTIIHPLINSGRYNDIFTRNIYKGEVRRNGEKVRLCMKMVCSSC